MSYITKESPHACLQVTISMRTSLSSSFSLSSFKFVEKLGNCLKGHFYFKWGLLQIDKQIEIGFVWSESQHTDHGPYRNHILTQNQLSLPLCVCVYTKLTITIRTFTFKLVAVYILTEQPYMYIWICMSVFRRKMKCYIFFFWCVKRLKFMNIIKYS